MTLRSWVQFAPAAALAIVAGCLFFAWRGAQRDQAKLQTELGNAQQAIAAANSRQQSRDTQLEQLLAHIRQQKRSVQKPAEVVRGLSEELPLPKAMFVPFARQEAAPTNSASSQMPRNQSKDWPLQGSAPGVVLPKEDLKPLYDFALDCKACRAELSVAQANLKDEQIKSQTLRKERDDALRVSRGGSLLQRMTRAAKWFVIGAAAGAVAAKAAH